MKIGILTLPLLSNYGGILQNYALQQVLRSLGHEPVTLNLPFPPDKKSKAKTSTERENYQLRTANIQAFMSKYLDRTDLLTWPFAFEQIKGLGLNGYVVGSDQVWRPTFSKRRFLKAMFLDFLPDDCDAVRLVYAASFGSVHWSLGRKLVYKMVLARYARKFAGISVREDIGAEYCKRYLGQTTPVVLDPVMLLQAGDYSEKLSLGEVPGANLMCYVLDPTDAKNACIDIISKQLGGKTSVAFGSYDSTEGVMPSPIDWLNGFKNAEFVITDSFHGTVLSILFGKPFIVFANEARGLDRFHTLLRPLKLESRMMSLQGGNYEL
ncbi:MAG: polysaccharide pyruvyl transferase family protein, partial [Victivallales bacterium]|nr:polysaccharide pyruvyl transferase family protein [Victivallales bacterium]